MLHRSLPFHDIRQWTPRNACMHAMYDIAIVPGEGLAARPLLLLGFI